MSSLTLPLLKSIAAIATDKPLSDPSMPVSPIAAGLSAESGTVDIPEPAVAGGTRSSVKKAVSTSPGINAGAGRRDPGLEGRPARPGAKPAPAPFRAAAEARRGLRRCLSSLRLRPGRTCGTGLRHPRFRGNALTRGHAEPGVARPNPPHSRIHLERRKRHAHRRLNTRKPKLKEPPWMISRP